VKNMALRDIFKKRRSSKEEIKKKEVEEKKEEKKPLPLKDVSVKKRKGSDLAYKILKSPQITEKATELSSQNQYVFKVFPRANKFQIKKAIEQNFKVDVERVRIINTPKKPKTMGRIKGWKKGYKKAIVKVKQGQKIDIDSS